MACKRVKTIFHVLIVLASSCAALSFCSLPVAKRSNSTAAIRFLSSVPYIDDNGKVLQFETSIDIAQQGEFFLLRIPSISIKNRYPPQNATDSKEIVTHSVNLVYNYFAFKNGVPLGIWYDSLNSEKGRFLSVDSIKSLCNFYDCENVISQGKDNDSLVYELGNKHKLVEKYVPKKKYDESYPDTMELKYINKYILPDFSLSRECDSISKMKLVNVRMIYNENTKSAFEPFRTQKREIHFSIAELTLAPHNDIDSVIQRFLNEVNKK